MNNSVFRRSLLPCGRRIACLSGIHTMPLFSHRLTYCRHELFTFPVSIKSNKAPSLV